MTARSTFTIRREDTAVDAVTFVTEGLLIGSLPSCDLFLNHPTVGRSHAGVRRIGKTFYIFPLSATSATILNTTAIEAGEPRALAAGDAIQIGTFIIEINDAQVDKLMLTVRLAVALNAGEVVARSEAEQVALLTSHAKPPVDVGDIEADALAGDVDKSLDADDKAQVALEVFWQKRQREAGKIARPTPLHPRGRKQLGKVRYNWQPTSDLTPLRYRNLLIVLAFITVLGSLLAAFLYAEAFSPAALSAPHTRRALAFTPAIARTPNGDSCTSCHTLNAAFGDSPHQMNTACAACHTTEIFASAMTRAHTVAGIGCSECHAEHQGADFSPRRFALQSCAACHANSNRNTYNGKQVFTAHGGTFGYPVNEHGEWTWRGLTEDERRTKDEALQRLINTETGSDARTRAVNEFHAVHLYRVRAVAGMPSNEQGEMSCSSCHRTFQPIDRETPRLTCAQCHNGKQDVLTGATLINSTEANCTSCHVQHLADKRHWNSSLMSKPDEYAVQKRIADALAMAAHQLPRIAK